MSKQVSCGEYIKQIHDELKKRANNAMCVHDMTMTQFSALIALHRSSDNQMTLKEIESTLHLAQSTTAGIINRLEQKKYVESFSDLSDKRIKKVRITSEGKKYCLLADKSMEQTENELLSGLTDTEKSIFHSLLQKVWNTIK